MTTLLPTSSRPVATFDEWLGYVRHRLAQATRLDPWRGMPHVAALSIGTRRGVLCLRLAIACLASSVGAGWLLRWEYGATLAAAALLLGAIAWREMRSHRRRALERTAESDFAVAALVMANDGLFDPDVAADLPGVLCVTRDPALMADPQRLRSLAGRLFELKSRSESGIPEPLRAIAATLASEAGWFPTLQVPREWAGNDATFVKPCWFERRFLPHRAIERRIFAVFVHPRVGDHPLELLPPEMWWRTEIDAALARDFGLRDSEGDT